MIQWMQTVIQFTGFDTETVEIAVSYLDRFLMTKSGAEALNCRETFQLAAMVSLYTSVKINAPEALTPKLLAELSQGAYNEEQVEDMERIILLAINWRVNPATSVSFVREVLSALPDELFGTQEDKDAALELARSQAEWAVGDYELMTVKKSIIAFSALENALERLNIHYDLQKFLRDNILSSEKSSTVELDLKEAIMLKKPLREALPGMNDYDLAVSDLKGDVDAKLYDDEIRRGRTPVYDASPRSVNYKGAAA